MKTWIFIFLLSGLTFNKALAVTPSRLLDGKPEFAICTIGGEWVFSQARHDAILEEKPSAVVVELTPTTFELQVAHSGLKFKNYSDFVECVESKDHLDNKILDMKPSEAKREKTKIDALKAENNKR